MGLFGPPNVKKMKAKKDLDGLITALNYKKDLAVCISAAQALGELGDSQTVVALITALEEWVYGRNVLIKALGLIGDPRAVDTLINKLKKGDLRFDAIEALGKIGDPKAMESLINMLRIENLGNSTREAIFHALIVIGTPAEEPLIKVLTGKDDDIRFGAARALNKIGWMPEKNEVGAVYGFMWSDWDECIKIGAPAVKPLINFLMHKDIQRRSNAAYVLGKIGDTRAVEPLITLLNDVQNVRESASVALVEIGSQAIESLLPRLDDNNLTMRKMVTQTLDKISWKPEKNESGAIYWIIKRQWDECIKIGSPSIKPLIKVLKDKSPKIREAAAHALDEIGWKPEKNEIGVTYWIIKNQFDKCIKIGEPAVEPLISLLKKKNGKNRRDVAEALVALYQSGQLDEKHQGLILSCRSTITKGHLDEVRQTRHGDFDRSASYGIHPSDCNHIDNAKFSHEDSGFDIDFPV